MRHSGYMKSVRIEPLEGVDDFPTPPWATRALLEHIINIKSHQSCLEPACNRGHMAEPLKEYFGWVKCADVEDYGYPGTQVSDFMNNNYQNGSVSWSITNPPFKLGAEFFHEMHRVTRDGVALFVRSTFTEGQKRYRDIYSVNPPTKVAQFVERVPICKGRLDPKLSTATSYLWLVWEKHRKLEYPEYLWIPPCRKELERDGDYPDEY